MVEPRMTLATKLVVDALLDAPDRSRYGLDLSAACGLPSGTLHPVLARLERIGWLESDWEDIDPSRERRPRRRCYRLSPDGMVAARTALAQAYAARPSASMRLRPAQGTS